MYEAGISALKAPALKRCAPACVSRADVHDAERNLSPTDRRAFHRYSN